MKVADILLSFFDTIQLVQTMAEDIQKCYPAVGKNLSDTQPAAIASGLGAEAKDETEAGETNDEVMVSLEWIHGNFGIITLDDSLVETMGFKNSVLN